MHTYMQTGSKMHYDTYLHVYTYTCMHTRVYTHIRTCLNIGPIRIQLYILYIHACVHTHMRTYIVYSSVYAGRPIPTNGQTEAYTHRMQRKGREQLRELFALLYILNIIKNEALLLTAALS